MVERIVQAPRRDVFAVLADGWTYSDWVVGTSHIRAVDAAWPRAGTEIHHKAGPWPLALQDRTVSLRCEEPELLVLSPRMWPLGQALVSIQLFEEGPSRTRIRLDEDFEKGPLRWVRTKINDLILHYRNRESLRRLGDIAVRRSHPVEGATVQDAAVGDSRSQAADATSASGSAATLRTGPGR
jgi:hypothetical protein